MLDRARVFELVRRNRADILAVDYYFRAKIGALWRWGFHYLVAEGRAKAAALLRAMTMEERLAWLRRNVWRLERLGATRSAFYARAIISETDARTGIEELGLYLPRIKETGELLRQAIVLKEREAAFFRDLIRSLLSYLPAQTTWIAEVERVLRLVVRRLEELLRMTGSLEGHVYDIKTRKPIEGASVEIADLRATTDREGHYKIDSIPAGTYVARCLAPEYEAQEQDVEIRGGVVATKDWYLKRVVVPPPPVTRVLQSRMFYRSYKAKMTPQPFAFLVVFVKTREPGKYPEEFLKSALDFLTKDPEAFPTLGMAITSVGTLWLKRGKFTTYPAGAYSVDGRSVRAVDWDEVEGEARKFGVSPEELIDQIRYTCVFYRIRMGVARIYREYIGKLEFREGRWVIIPDWGRTRVEPRETLMPEAPSVEELEI